MSARGLRWCGQPGRYMAVPVAVIVIVSWLSSG